jgi:calcineurin-like phosphoesterase family protein
MRPWDDPHVMNKEMIEYWNDTVEDDSVIWHLGDVVINRRYLGQVMPLLRGRKRLVGGNHDVFKLHDYSPWFEDIKGVGMLQNDEGHYDIVLSHIPLHADSIDRFGANVHGHYHANHINDPRYLCVCVEQINYRPIELSVVRERIARNKVEFAKTKKVIDFTKKENH